MLIKLETRDLDVKFISYTDRHTKLYNRQFDLLRLKKTLC